ncbi:MAG TPA: RNA polymerase sigma factor [Thermoguttaceae bacterium]|nr:RNA polymerase sigma factor [Thermoguttaceae bacterium]
MKSDAETVRRVLSGDRSAFAELIRRHECAVITAAWSILGEFHLAQDTAQEAFLTAYHSLATLRDASSFGPWVLKITRRKAQRESKQRSRMRTATLTDDVIGRDCPEPGDLRERLIQAIGRLPEQHQSVVMLRYLGGHSVRSIALMTGRSVGTVTKQLSRSVARLRKLMEKVKT